MVTISASIKYDVKLTFGQLTLFFGVTYIKLRLINKSL